MRTALSTSIGLAAIGLRRARTVAICAAIGLALGIVYLLFTPSVYTASTRILLDDSLTRYAEEKGDARPYPGGIP